MIYRKFSSSKSFSDLKYAVFGLGNKTYEHFNAMAKFVDQKLQSLGGKRIHPLGLGDDDANLEDDFITWKEAFWQSVCVEFKIEAVGDDFRYKILTNMVVKLSSCLTSTPTIQVQISLSPQLFCKIVVEKNEDKQKEARFGPC